MSGQQYARTKGPVVIELSVSEALVLFELIANFNDRKDFVFEDQAEYRMMAYLECILERQLAEPFAPNYYQLLKEARDTVRDED